MSGLLPHNPGTDPNNQGSGGIFTDITTGALIVNGAAVINSLTVNSGATFNGPVDLGYGINVDTIGSHTAGGDIDVTTTATGKIDLNGVRIDPSGDVTVPSGTTITSAGDISVNTVKIGPTGVISRDTNTDDLTLFVAAPGAIFVANAQFESTGTLNIPAGQRIRTDNIQSTSGGNITFANEITLPSALPVTSGGTGLSTATLGSMHYGSGTNLISNLSGNTTTTPNYFSQTGTGVVSAAPSWKTPTQVKTDLSLNNVENTALSTWAGSTNLTTVGTLSPALPVVSGGNGLATATLGDITYGSGTNTKANLAGNTTSTVNYFSQTGNGSVSAAPAWKTPTQVKTDLSLNNVENTALSTWAGSSNITTLGNVASCVEMHTQGQLTCGSLSTASFTPSLTDSSGNSFTGLTNEGTWFRLGAIRFVTVWIQWTGKGSAVAGDNVRIGGFPIVATGSRFAFAVAQSNGVGTTTQRSIGAGIDNSNDFLWLWGNVTGTSSILLVSDLATAGELQITGWYY